MTAKEPLVSEDILERVEGRPQFKDVLYGMNRLLDLATGNVASDPNPRSMPPT